MIHFRILGPLDAVDEGRALQLGRPKQRALLAILLLHANEVISTDRLIDQLWTGEPPANAVNTLQATISRLRKALGDVSPGSSRLLATRSPGYVLELKAEQLDLTRFERLVAQGREALAGSDAETAAQLLRTALSLWRGPPLADLAYEPFVQAEAARLEEARLEALELRAEADLERGHHAVLVGELEALVSEHPLRERLRSQLMLALYRSERQAEALQVYQDARRMLVDELGIEPSRGLQQLERAILVQDPSIDLAPARASTAAAGGGGSAVALMPVEEALPAPPLPVAGPPGSERQRGLRSRRSLLAAGTATLVAISGVAVGLLLAFTGGDTPVLGATALGLVDADSGRVVRSADLEPTAVAIAVGAGSLWVVQPERGTVLRIDPVRVAVQDVVQVGPAPSAVTVAAGSVWVANGGSGTVSRISPETGEVIQTIRVGNGPAGIAATRGAMWVTNSIDGSVTKVDTATGKPRMTVSVGGAPTAIAATRGGVWVANRTAGVVTELDARTGAVLGSVAVGNAPSSLAVGRDAVWVANASDRTVSKIDAASAEVRVTVPVAGAPSAVAFARGALWVALSGGKPLVRLDPATGRVLARGRVGATPAALAASGGGLWAATLPPTAEHRGGTIRFTLPALYSIDPAHVGMDPRIAALVYHGLVSYRHEAGAAGGEIVPDLARALPTLSEDRREYTFRLREAIRFSNGGPVRASDVRASFERLLQTNDTPFYRDILGADRCTPSHCDLSRGVKADDETGRVTIRLARPESDFVHTLALPNAAVLPAGTPPHDVDDPRPIPGTGPYRIVSYQPGTTLVLERRTAFKSWSPEAAPPGFADRIEAHLSSELVEGDERAVQEATRDVAAVLAGKSDWAEVPQTYPVERLLVNGAARVHLEPFPPRSIFSLMNAKRPPFDDVRVRRALNFAVDRRRIAALAGDPRLAEVTCQILPPGFPGYVPYCPYTRDPSASGTWTAPDLDRARALVRASGKEGARVEVWTLRDGGFREALGLELARTLRALGFRASVKAVEDDYFAEVDAHRPQVAFMSWGADYLSPANFFGPIFTCHGEVNWTGLCDRDVDKAIEEASSAGGVRESTLAWSRIDRRLVDAAPVIPLIAPRMAILTSRRAGNLVVNPLYGVMLDRLWVR